MVAENGRSDEAPSGGEWVSMGERIRNGSLNDRPPTCVLLAARWLQDHPDDLSVVWRHAVTLYEMVRYDEAIEILMAASERFPKPVGCCSINSAICIATGLPDSRTQCPQPPSGTSEQQAPGSDTLLDPPAGHGQTFCAGHRLLTGQRALVTGGDSGIGRASAVAYAKGRACQRGRAWPGVNAVDPRDHACGQGEGLRREHPLRPPRPADRAGGPVRLTGQPAGQLRHR